MRYIIWEENPVLASNHVQGALRLISAAAEVASLLSWHLIGRAGWNRGSTFFFQRPAGTILFPAVGWEFLARADSHELNLQQWQEYQIKINATRQEDYVIPASLADQMFDPSLGSTVCKPFIPASRNLATCNIFGCHMNCCIAL